MSSYALRWCASCLVGLACTSALVGANADSTFERLQSLQGEWVGPDDDGDGAPDYTFIYESSSNGSAIRVRQFPGDPHEMTNMIHKDGDTVLLTHYCAIGNQPRMKAPGKVEGNSIHFDFVHATNMSSEDQTYMGEVTITIEDENTLREEWTSFREGEEVGTMAFQLTRKQSKSGVPEAQDMQFHEYFVLIYNHGPNHSTEQSPEMMELMAGHLNHIRGLRDDGKLIMGGPFGDQSGGMLIIKADSRDAVEQWGAMDPAVKAGHLTADIRPWMVPASDDW